MTTEMTTEMTTTERVEMARARTRKAMNMPEAKAQPEPDPEHEGADHSIPSKIRTPLDTPMHRLWGRLNKVARRGFDPDALDRPLIAELDSLIAQSVPPQRLEDLELSLFAALNVGIASGNGNGVPRAPNRSGISTLRSIEVELRARIAQFSAEPETASPPSPFYPVDQTESTCTIIHRLSVKERIARDAQQKEREP